MPARRKAQRRPQRKPQRKPKGASAAGGGEFRDWPAGASPQEVGRRVAENFAGRSVGGPDRIVVYPEVCAWYGALTFARLYGEPGLQDRLIRKFEPLLSPEGSQSVSPEAHVDFRVFGAVPLEIYLQTKITECLELGLRFADGQWRSTTPDGISADARYWIDDMFMITLLQVQAHRATGRAEYLDRTALAMDAYLGRLQQPNGLFFHAPDAPFHWSRGNGWMAAGTAELLRALPEDHPRRERILAGYRKLMDALLPLQGPDGMWRQLLDRPEAWPESSGTGMFAFAMMCGVKNGWLDRGPYGRASRDAWLGLVGRLDRKANVRDVCAGTPTGTSVEYYLDRPRVTGDLHGQAPILWCASALLG
jgi:unsaturated rhamnogalacturonyl hydrolase